MQYHMSTAPGLAPPPSAPGLAPEVVRSAPEPPRKRGPWLILLLVAAIAGGVSLWYSRSVATQKAASQTGPVAAIRTATVTSGSVVRTTRLTGTTGAERFASLLVPQLRGSRAEALREGREFQSPGSNYPVPSNARASAGGGSVGPGSSGGGSGGDSQASMGGGGSTGGGSSALRSATSRVSSGSRSGGGSTRIPINTGSGSGSGNALGSTAGALQGTGTGGGGGAVGGGGGGRGGGGGMGDFSLVLQDSAKGGTFVKKGTPVAEFDRQYMMTRLEDYRAAMTQMEASFRKLQAEIEVQKRIRKVNIDNAKAALDKAKLDLKTIPVMGAMDTERLKLSAEEAEAKYNQLLAEEKFAQVGFDSQMRVAEFELKQARIELARAEANADRMILKAPIDGLVVMQTTFRGSEYAQIQAGDQLWAGMRFMQIVDPSSMVVNATVNQVDADSVRVGAKATVRFDAFPGLELPATVHALGAMTKPGGARASYVKEIPVILKLDKMDPRVIPDLSVSVDVELEKETQAAAVVPASAIFTERDSTTQFVFVKAAEGWQKREVELGVVNNLVAAVRSGLRPGEVVAAEYPPAEVRKPGQS